MYVYLNTDVYIYLVAHPPPTAQASTHCVFTVFLIAVYRIALREVVSRIGKKKAGTCAEDVILQDDHDVGMFTGSLEISMDLKKLQDLT